MCFSLCLPVPCLYPVCLPVPCLYPVCPSAWSDQECATSPVVGCCSLVPLKLFSRTSYNAQRQPGRNRSTNLRMMPLFPSLQWNGQEKKQLRFCFIYFLGLVFSFFSFNVLLSWCCLKCLSGACSRLWLAMMVKRWWHYLVTQSDETWRTHHFLKAQESTYSKPVYITF